MLNEMLEQRLVTTGSGRKELMGKERALARMLFDRLSELESEKKQLLMRGRVLETLRPPNDTE